MKICHTVRFCAFAILTVQCVFGGMSMYWRTEKNRPFGGNVDSECRLNVCEELGEITFAKGEFSIPLIVDFYSGRNTKSPTMGAYWILNVADLRLLKNDVNSYSLFFPNGTESIFYKDSGKNTYRDKVSLFVLSERSNMQTLKDKNGYSYSFKNASLTQIKAPSGNALNFIYKDGRLASINGNNEELAKFEYSPESVTINFPRSGKTATLSFEASQDGKLGAMLSRIEIDGALLRSYEYDFRQAQWAKLKITDGRAGWREYSFEKNGGKVSEESFIENGKQDRYSYDYSPHSLGGFQVSRILRSSGAQDLWYGYNAVISVRKNGGPIVTTHYFARGALRDFARRIETSYPDGSKTASLFVYDDKQRILREIRDGGVVFNMKYNDVKNSASCYDGAGNFLWEKRFDKGGRLAAYIRPDGTRLDIKYADNSTAEATLTKDGKKINTAVFDESLLFIKSNKL